MNSLENQMLKLLEDLRDNHGAVEVKSEFEAEAARLNEIMRLKEIATKAGLGLVLKIGGCEAISDMFEVQHIGVSGVIAPMIESGYAMKKFQEAVEKNFSLDLRKNIHFGINVETYLAYKNLREILAIMNKNLIDTLTLGRVDMVGSIGLARNDINSSKIYKIAEDIFKRARKKGIRTTMGGGIAKEAAFFIKKLLNKKLLDRFETRKIVFNAGKTNSTIEDSIIKANKFEILWLKNKKNYYKSIFHEDDERIKMLKRRIKNLP